MISVSMAAANTEMPEQIMASTIIPNPSASPLRPGSVSATATP
jgi:hypothetical protein